MDHGSQRHWVRPILRCFKHDFFGEALQRSEKCIQMAVSCSRPSDYSVSGPVMSAARDESDVVAVAALTRRR